MKLSKKIGLSFSLATVVLISVVMWVLYESAKENLEHRIAEHLETTAELKAEWINAFFAERRGDTAVLALSDDVKTAFEKLEAYFEDSGAVPTGPLDISTQTYKKIYNEIDPFFRRYVEAYGCYDLFFICGKGSQVMYTAAKEAELGTNLSTGPFKDSGLAKLWAKVVKDKKASFTDFEYYAPSDGPAMFIGAPVFNERGDVYAVVALQVSTEQINEIMQNRTGLGETGETYLVGKDYLMRSDSRFSEESTILKQKVDTVNARDCFANEAQDLPHKWYEEAVVFPDYRGVNVLGAHVYIPEVNWALLAEIDEEEAFASLAKLRVLAVIAFGAALAVICLISILISKSITKPISQLCTGTEIIGSGNLNFKVGINAKDEIGQLSRAFDKMTDDLKKTTASRDELDAANQQLQANEQHLKATNQQLDAANQQLQANEQQLKAANQQLQANEQQLKATNQQLQANEQQLKAANQQLNASNQQFQASEQQLKAASQQLNASNQQLQSEIEERKQAEKKLAKTHRKLVDTAREVGKGEMATSVLHNVGNVVNSVNVTAGTIKEKLRDSKISDIVRVTELLKEHEGDLGDFLTNDQKGQKIPLYLESLSEHLIGEQQGLLEMIDSLTGHVQHITEIISIQQSFHKTAALTEVVSVDELIEEAVAINVAGLNRHDVNLRRQYQQLPTVVLDRHKLLQIVINLISNAKYAVSASKQENKHITIRTRKLEDDQFQIEVCDNGTGIPAEDITRIFSSGFTTRKEGHGYGLHSAALTVKEMGGSLNVSSEGPGKGATFTLQLPLKPANRPCNTHHS